jgi:hypothetical protein
MMLQLARKVHCECFEYILDPHFQSSVVFKLRLAKKQILLNYSSVYNSSLLLLWIFVFREQF